MLRYKSHHSSDPQLPIFVLSSPLLGAEADLTEADLAAKLEAEQEAARLVKVEASTATEGDDPDKCCSNDADDGK